MTLLVITKHKPRPSFPDTIDGAVMALSSDDPLQKVAISGPTLASLIQRIFTSESDIDGLLFGHVTTSFLSLSDDDPSTSTTLTATVTSFISAASKPYFYNSTGQIDLPKLRSLLPPSPSQSQSPTLIGWFSGRRQTHPRPSMREYGVSRSLSSKSEFNFSVRDSDPNLTFSPCLFLLFTTPYSSTDQAIHTHEYRAYQFRSSAFSFEPRSIHIVNIGPAFRSHYSSFSPSSSMFPMLSYENRSNPIMEDKVVSLSEKKRIANDQQELDMCAQGFEVGKLSRLVGSEAVNYTSSLEGLYGSMLAKLEGLARQVEKSNALINEKEYVYGVTSQTANIQVMESRERTGNELVRRIQLVPGVDLMQRKSSVAAPCHWPDYQILATCGRYLCFCSLSFLEKNRCSLTMSCIP